MQRGLGGLDPNAESPDALVESGGAFGLRESYLEKVPPSSKINLDLQIKFVTGIVTVNDRNDFTPVTIN